MAQDKIVVTIKGGEALLREMKRIGVDVADVLEVAALAGGEVIAEAAGLLAPEPLIEAETAKKSRVRVEVDVGMPREKWYWQFFELGATAHEIAGAPLVFEGRSGTVVTQRVSHTGMAPEPFLRPAFDRKKKGATDEVGDELWGGD